MYKERTWEDLVVSLIPNIHLQKQSILADAALVGKV